MRERERERERERQSDRQTDRQRQRERERERQREGGRERERDGRERAFRVFRAQVLWCFTHNYLQRLIFNIYSILYTMMILYTTL